AKGKGACWGFEAEVVGRVWKMVEWQESGDEWVEVFGGKPGRPRGRVLAGGLKLRSWEECGKWWSGRRVGMSG
nr:hypothetical protein [Tanacetum cinerariifolium]